MSDKCYYEEVVNILNKSFETAYRLLVAPMQTGYWLFRQWGENSVINAEDSTFLLNKKCYGELYVMAHKHGNLRVTPQQLESAYFHKSRV